MRTSLTTLLAAALLSLTLHADAPTPVRNAKPDRTALWVTIGAGAGFGLGLLLGLAVFDDARYSERKIWTTAAAGGAAGGVTAWLLTRGDGQHRTARRPRAHATSLPDEDILALARKVRLSITVTANESGRGF